jgi:hypothetical protein
MFLFLTTQIEYFSQEYKYVYIVFFFGTLFLEINVIT